MKTDHWQEDGNKLCRKFEFDNFIDAIGFLARVAIISEKQNHHAELYNLYNIVTIKMNTHDAGDIVTEKDHRLAKSINELL